MPIKFRCEYCRQLLGIAHSKAGSLVDCPTCGRTLRVPNRDGTVDPAPVVGLDLADDGLRRALDELAQLGQVESKPEPALKEVPAQAADELPSVGKPSTRGLLDTPPVIVKPKPIVPVPQPAVLPSNAVALEPLPPMAVVNPPAAPRPNPAGINQSVPAPSLAGSSPEDILAGLAGPAAVRPAVSSPPAPERPIVPGYSRTTLIAVGLCSLLIGCGLGWGLTRALTTTASTAASSETAPEIVPAAATGPLLEGRITFRNARGQLEPDAGAILILLPVPRGDAAKLSSLGLRPNDETQSRQSALKILEEQGGRLAIAKANGSFRVELPQPGTYQVIALSHYQGRSPDAAGPEDARKVLEEIFDRPDQLVGKLAFHVAEINLPEAGAVIWDHTFSR